MFLTGQEGLPTPADDVWARSGALSVSATTSAADLTTFANFQETSSAKDMKWVGSGDDGHLYTVSSPVSAALGATKVFFSFPGLASNLKAKLTFDGTVTCTPATGSVSDGTLLQRGVAATFSFVLDGAQSIDGHLYADGTNLLSGTMVQSATIRETSRSEGNVSASTVDSRS